MVGFRTWLLLCGSFAVVVNLSYGKPSGADQPARKVVCYYGSWAVYRPSNGAVPVEKLDPFLCTHLIYGFAGLSSANKIVSLDEYNDLEENWGEGAFKRFNALKKQNPKLKTIIAIGGWNEGSTKYSHMASSSTSRKTFINSVVAFLSKYGFDGLDMDWEYPANRGGNAEDKQNFVLLLKELHEAFQTKGYILTSAVSAGKATIDTAYNIPEISKYLDIINLMTYDFHGEWDPFTGHNSPLYARLDETAEQATFNLNFSVNYWINHGAPRDKIVVGLGLYGRGFTLQNPSKNGFYAPTTGPSQGGPYTEEAGMLGYNEICEDLQKGGWTTVFDDYYMAPYSYKGRTWVGYDDRKSIELKAKYIVNMGVGGGMVWSVDTDDFRGVCHGTPYPLLSVLSYVLRGDVVRPPVTHSPVTNRPVTSPTGGTCKEEGWFRDASDCSIYWRCIPIGGDRFDKEDFKCDSGTVFDLVNKICNWPNNVSGC